jgi:putative endonuclease
LYYIYLLANWNNKVLYAGVTNNLECRLFEHKNDMIEGFTKKYRAHKLVWFDSTPDVKTAIEYEKKIKGWKKEKKNALIESMNPDWRDLSEGWEG